jgi:drug/metabolite transporter (DMT)-like permease
MSNRLLMGPALALVINALVWGTSWWPFRQLQGMGLHPLWTTVFVYGFAVLVILARKPGALRELLAAPTLWILVLASGATNACFNWAVAVGDVVRVVLLFYLMPLWSVLLARWLLNEPITPLALARVALALAGAALVLSAPGAAHGGGHASTLSWPWPQNLADWLGVIGGFSFALNNVMLRREAARSDSSRALAMFVGGVLVAGCMGVVLAAQGRIGWLPQFNVMWVGVAFVLALLFLASNLALQHGASNLPANVTSVIMLSEVVFASVSAWLLGGGVITLGVLAGGALIMAAALVATLQARPAATQAMATLPHPAD